MKIYVLWLRVLWIERGWEAIRGVWLGLLELRSSKVDKLEWRRRARVCIKCPIYNAEYRSCRTGSMGCGCYIPFSNLVKNRCWGREKYGGVFGWGVEDKS